MFRLAELYAILEGTRDKFAWHVDAHGKIRGTMLAVSGTIACCPLTAACFLETGNLFDETRAIEAAEKLDLPFITASWVVMAADDWSLPSLVAIRSDILGALHLTEPVRV